jgi:hypothetical protein
MKFRKEHQKYLLIVLAIITAGYFLKPYFFNKNKKVVEGQANNSEQYYRINLDLTNPPQISEDELKTNDYKHTILKQFKPDEIKISSDGSSKFIETPSNIFETLRMSHKMLNQFNVLEINESGQYVAGIKVKETCDMLGYFNKHAIKAANLVEDQRERLNFGSATEKADSNYNASIDPPTRFITSRLDNAAAEAAASALAAHDYARIILEEEHQDKYDILALIAAANLLALMGQDVVNDEVVKEALGIARAAAVNTAADFAAAAEAAFLAEVAADQAAYAALTPAADAALAAEAAALAALAAEAAAEAAEEAALAAADAAGITQDSINEIYANNPANLKNTFIAAAGLIYQSVYAIIQK